MRVIPLVLVFCVACSTRLPRVPAAVPLPGGSFAMGTSAEALQRFRAMFPDLSDRVFEGERQRQTVTVAPFAIDRFEVTNEAYARFTAPSHAGANHPVVNVTWHDADAFCRARGGRLPTEAEWEYAARGGLEEKLFPWGDEKPDPSKANYGASNIGTTTPVGSYPSNGYGLFDMSGNVWEWTADRWSADGDRYVIRGGSYGGAPVNLRVAYRDSHRAGDARPFVGFRCAYDLP